MRKASLEIEATVLIPVTVSLDVEIRADDGANMEQAVRRYLARKRYSKANVENLNVGRVKKIAGNSIENIEFQLEDAAQKLVDAGEVTLAKVSMWNVV